MSSFLRKKKPVQQTTKTEINPTSISNTTEINKIDQKDNIKQENSLSRSKIIHDKPTLQFSDPQVLLNKCDNNVKFVNQQIPSISTTNQQIPPPPTNQQNQKKLRPFLKS